MNVEKTELIRTIEQCKAGDPQAQEKLILEVQKSVHYQCMKMLKHEANAEDMTQEILISMLTSLDKLQEPAAFWGWLNTMTMNRCRNQLGRGYKESQIPEDEEGNSLLDQYETLDEQSIPDKSLDTAETRRMIGELVDALPDAQRMTVLMYYYDEMAVKEITQAMDTTEGTVKSRLNYARKSIKEGVDRYTKQGIKLYSVSVLPFLLYFLREDAEACSLSQEQVMQLTASTMKGVSAATGPAATSGAVGTSAANAGSAAAGTAAKAGMGVGTKVAAGVLAAAVAVGGGAAIGHEVHTKQLERQAQQLEQQQEENLSLLRDYFSENYHLTDDVYVADFDKDGFQDMLIAFNDDNWIEQCDLVTIKDGTPHKTTLMREPSHISTYTDYNGEQYTEESGEGLYIGLRERENEAPTILLSDGTTNRLDNSDFPEGIAWSNLPGGIVEYDVDETGALTELNRTDIQDVNDLQNCLLGTEMVMTSYYDLGELVDVAQVDTYAVTQLEYPCEKIPVLNGKATLLLPEEAVQQINIVEGEDRVDFWHKETQKIDPELGILGSLYFTNIPAEDYEVGEYFEAAKTAGGRILYLITTDVQFVERAEDYPGTDYQAYTQRYVDLYQLLKRACSYLEVTES